MFTALALLCGVCSFGAAAADTTRCPVIIVPGYAASQLYCSNEDGSREQVWYIGTDEILAKVLGNIAEVGLGMGMLAFGRADMIARTVGQGMTELCGKLACSDDGSDQYGLSLYYTSAEDTCSANLMEQWPDGSFRHEAEIMAEVAQYTGNGNIFNFQCDFRKSVLDCAAVLGAYIQDVLQYTGSDKVNIIAVSHGGQITAAYLTLYGHKQQVDNAVLNVPAIGGAGLAVDALTGSFDFDEEELLYYVEYGMMEEIDYHWLAAASRFGFLDDILEQLHPYIIGLVGHWKSMWDFVPREYYDALKEELLDKDKNAAIIASSDYFHHTLMPLFSTSLRRCNDEYGMNVSIIAGTDHTIVTGLKVNADGIIPVTSSTGATVAPAGSRFPDGYKALNGDSRYVSPAMTVDASTAYLPDNTWFVEGLFHGMEYKDDYSARLLMKLLLTDDITDVYSDPAYPRFHATTNNSLGVFAAFDSSAEGIVCSKDTALTVTNLSKKYRMKILAVTSGGMRLRFYPMKTGLLEPGESVSLPFRGKVPAVNSVCAGITVTYLLVGSPTPLGQRTLRFTVMNGP